MTVSWPTCWALGRCFARGDTRDRRPTIRFVSGRFAVFLTGCFQSPIKTPRYSTGCAPSCPRRYITGHFSLSIPHHHFSKHHTLLYTIQCGRGTTAKLERIFISSSNTPQPRPTHASQSSNHATKLCSKQRISSASSTHSHHPKYPRMMSPCLHQLPTLNQSTRDMHNTMGQSHL